MKLGTSLRFLFPTSPATHERFRSILTSLPKGAFIDRPMGAYSPEEQARNLMEVASAARAAGLDALLSGDSHAAHPGYAATFSPLPIVARLMSVTGDMPVGAVLLAPFYHPLLLAEQIGTLAAFAEGPLIVTFVLGGSPAAVSGVRHGGTQPRRPPRGGGDGGARAPLRRARHPPRPLLHVGERHHQSSAAGPPWRSGSEGRCRRPPSAQDGLAMPG